MLPFTTYNIPDSFEKKMPSDSQWLWIIMQKPLSPENESLLTKICTAIKALYPSDVYLISSLNTEDMAFTPLVKKDLRLVISFGILPSDLGLWIDLTRPGIRYLESFAFILTSTLDELNASPAMKKQLWSSMLSFLDKK